MVDRYRFDVAETNMATQILSLATFKGVWFKVKNYFFNDKD